MSYHCPNCGKKNKISFNFCYKCGKRLKYLHLDEFKEKPREKPTEFKVNEFITLKLEKEKTIIYINGKKFTQCKYLLIEIPVDKIEDYDDILSIDDASSKLDHSLEKSYKVKNIPPEVEFWGHCSNLQVWVEYNYDTRLLHSNLAFPLLKKLTEVGDPLAKRAFKEEIAKRIESGEKNVIKYLIIENYLEYLNSEEYKVVLKTLKENSIEEFKKEYEGMLDPLELTAFLDIINQNLHNLKILTLEPLKMIGENTLMGFSLEKERITQLNLINCDLEEVPESIGNLTKLKKLNLLGNNIRYLPKTIGKLVNLTFLNLNKNKIENLPETIGNLNSLEQIHLNYNLIKEIPKSITNLKALRQLNIWNNELTGLPDNIGDLINLEILGLSNNFIVNIPDSIVSLKNIRTMDISNNLLRELPKNMEKLQNLRDLWINNNKLRNLPLSIVSMESLKNLYLTGNPLPLNINSNIEEIRIKLGENGVNLW